MRASVTALPGRRGDRGAGLRLGPERGDDVGGLHNRDARESVPSASIDPGQEERAKHPRAALRQRANGAVTTASYDDLGRISTLGTESRGKAAQSLSYRYDQVGNLTAIDDALRKSGPLSASRTCGYDDLYRLVSAVGGDHSWTYAFNAVGDFTKKSDVGEYSYAKAHLVASAGGKSYRHDEAGNVVERPGSKLAFDAKGRLKAAALDDGTAVTYREDRAAPDLLARSCAGRRLT